ncbi:hypothetical protein ACIHFE_28165 [Streptomyces sp. NPDC052396]|uniref:hypothetical protein n=1 Tax=Streptomyces sp. NPDC052396 TaxID=3365689 RepID=UPI0037D0BC27
MAAVVGLSACGGKKSDSKDSASSSSSATTAQPQSELAKLSGNEISEKSKQALTSVTSMHMKIDRPGGSGNLDLTLDRQGNCVGTVFKGGGTMEIIKIGNKVWIKGDEAFINRRGGHSERAKLFQGRYIYGTTDDDQVRKTGSACDLAALQAKMAGERDKEEVTKGAPTTVNGQPVIPITSSKKTVIDVAATGKPYPLQVTKADQSKMTLSDFDKPVQPKEPPADQTVDIAKLKEQQGS